MIGYAFHPDAFADLDQLWEFIAANNVDAADRVIAEVFDTLGTLTAQASQDTAPEFIEGSSDGSPLAHDARDHRTYHRHVGRCGRARRICDALPFASDRPAERAVGRHPVAA